LKYNTLKTARDHEKDFLSKGVSRKQTEI